MRREAFQILTYFVLVVFLSFVGCATSGKSVAFDDIRGDQAITIETKDGKHYTFDHWRITDDRVVGFGNFADGPVHIVAKSEIESIILVDKTVETIGVIMMAGVCLLGAIYVWMVFDGLSAFGGFKM
jgi:hypothetical protein